MAEARFRAGAHRPKRRDGGGGEVGQENTSLIKAAVRARLRDRNCALMAGRRSSCGSSSKQRLGVWRERVEGGWDHGSGMVDSPVAGGESNEASLAVAATFL